MPDASMLMHLVAIPAIIAAIAMCICLALQRLGWSYFASLIAAFSIGLGPLLGLFLEEGLAIPPERDWHFVMCVLLTTSCAVGLVQVRILQAFMVCGLATSGAIFIFPSVDVDQEFQPYRMYWLVAIGISSLVNAYLFSRTAINGAYPWSGWVVVAQMAVISLALALNYATLAFSAIGILTSAAIYATIASISSLTGQAPRYETKDNGIGLPKAVWPIVALLPVTLATALLSLCFRIYNFGTAAAWVYLPLLFLPALVFTIDQLLLSTASTRRRTLFAMIETTAISMSVVIYLVLTGSTEDY